MKRSDFVRSMAQAMAFMEGFTMTSTRWRSMGRKLPASWRKEGDPITVAQINRNPGNLRYWPKTPVLYGYAAFPTVEAGWAALHAQIETNIFGLGSNWPRRRTHPMNFLEFFAGQRDDKGDLLPLGYPGFAPAADSNHPTTYATFVLGKLKETFPLTPAVTILTPIKPLISE